VNYLLKYLDVLDIIDVVITDAMFFGEARQPADNIAESLGLAFDFWRTLLTKSEVMTFNDTAADVMPVETWDKLPNETLKAYEAFCFFKGYDGDRNIRKAVDAFEEKKGKKKGRYSMWRYWSRKFQWMKRVGDYDQYIDKKMQEEILKSIEVHVKERLEISGEMLKVVKEKLAQMKAADLTPHCLPEWMEMTLRSDREAVEMVTGKDGISKPEIVNIVFDSAFERL